MSAPNKIAFITWDSPETNYLETLFLPIFNELRTKYGYQIHILQFSWLAPHELQMRKALVESYGFGFVYFQVTLKPVAFLGKFYSVIKQIKAIQNYCNAHGINWVMPRSLMPALAVNFCRFKTAKMVYDADGLPIEERVEANLLKQGSFVYNLYQRIQKNSIEKANLVLTRSGFACNYLSAKYQQPITKFAKVINGKNTNHFYFDLEQRNQIRLKLGLTDQDMAFIYCGSLGPKYNMAAMFALFKTFNSAHPNSKFIILTGQPNLISFSHPDVIIQTVASNEVFKYLSAADVALAILSETTSMKAAAAIKHAEYLLCGLPTILTEVGDIFAYPEIQSFLCHYKNDLPENTVQKFIFASKFADRKYIANQAKNIFSIQNAAASYHNALCQQK